jgi:hypothetical protein
MITYGVLAGHAPLADVMPGLAAMDVLRVAAAAATIALITTIAGVGCLRLLASRTLRVQVMLVVLVTLATSLASCGAFAVLMIGDSVDREIILELLPLAAVAGVVVAVFVGRTFSKASHTLLSAVQQVGTSGVFMPPKIALPAELAGLSDGLAEAHERLGKSRARERALEASRRELRTRSSSIRAKSAATIPSSASRPTGWPP